MLNPPLVCVYKYFYNSFVQYCIIHLAGYLQEFVPELVILLIFGLLDSMDFAFSVFLD